MSAPKIKLFEMELTATRISKETGISYPTTLKAVTAIRKAVAATTHSGRLFPLHQDNIKNTPVYYSMKRDGFEVSAQLSADRIKILERLERGFLICTERNARYDRLLCDGMLHYPADSGLGRPRYHFYLSHPFGMRRFIMMERLRRYCSVKDSLLALYVLEMEYRFNNRGSWLFDLLLEKVCSFIPPETLMLKGKGSAFRSADRNLDTALST